MKVPVALLTIPSAILLLFPSVAVGSEPFGTTGHSENTTLIEAPGSDEGYTLVCHWNELVDNGYCWEFDGVVPPDYGAWAECYDAAFICELHFYFTQTGYYDGQTCDVYVWDDTGEHPGGLRIPGNVLWAVFGAHPGPIAFWPSYSAHKFGPVNLEVPDHFIGFWGDWPGEPGGWYMCVEESGLPAENCALTKFAPGIGYPTGWGPIELIPIWPEAIFGLCEWVPAPVPTQETTWGKIKTLY